MSATLRGTGAPTPGVRRAGTATGGSRNPRLTGLYAITPEALCREPPRLHAAVEAALRGGARLIQYRDKSSPPNRRRTIALELLARCRRRDALLIVNDDPQLAREAGADGVHLGLSDAPLGPARGLLGPAAVIGVTCGNQLPRALAAQAGGASYVSFGRFFDSRTKPDAPPADIAVLHEARGKIALPICVIGGLTPQNAAPLVAAGASMVAAVSGVFDAADVAAAAHAYSRLFVNR